MEKEKSNQEEMVDIILDAINSSIGELTNQQRLKAIRAGQTKLRVRITLSELTELIKSRLDGLHGHEVESESDDLSVFDELFDEEDMVESIDVDMPSDAELRDHWLPMYVAKISGATLD